MIISPKTSEELSTLVETSEIPVLLDFYANWCGPCKALSPVLDQVDKSMGERVQIIKVDTDAIEDAAKKYGVRGIPTLVLLNSGEELGRKSGVLTKSTLESYIEAYLS